LSTCATHERAIGSKKTGLTAALGDALPDGMTKLISLAVQLWPVPVSMMRV
jgi:hypothetical protein